MKIRKVDSVHRNMDFAIEAYFSEKDIVPIWTIVGAAHSVAHDLLQKQKPNETFAHLSANANKTTVRETLYTFRKTPNWLKHADKDAESTLEICNSDLEHKMFLTILDLGRLFPTSIKHSNEASTFQLWYIAKYKATFGSPEYSNLVEASYKVFPDLDKKSQIEQLNAGNKILKNAN